ncbi:hypothetical protein [Terrisporobacter sp.]
MPFIAFIIPYAKFKDIEGPEFLSVYDEDFDQCSEAYVYRYKDEKAIDEEASLIPDLNEDFDVSLCVEDVYVKELEKKKIFKNVTINNFRHRV